jgi:hypothetical protein
MRVMHSAVLRLYPRLWRDRYGAEMLELVGSQPVSLRSLADLMAGAVDARLNPRLARNAAGVRAEGINTVSRSMCAIEGVTVRDQWRSAGWMVGGSLVLVLVAIGLKLRIGPNVASEAFLNAAFPASLMLSMECTYLKRYSSVARGAIAVGGAALILLIMVAASLVARMI